MPCYLYSSLRRIVVLLSFIGLTLHVGAQEAAMRHFTANDGLNGGRVYDIIEDRDGYLWAVTTNSICRFDGRSFRNFSLEGDPIARTGAFRVFQDKEGRIWFIPFSGKLFYFEDGSFHIPTFIKGIEKEPVTWIDQSSNGTLYMACRNGKIILSSPSGEKREFQLEEGSISELCILNDSIVLYSSRNAVYYLNSFTGVKKELIAPTLNEFARQKFIRFQNTASGSILITLSDHIRELSQDMQLKQYYTFSELSVYPDILNIWEENDSIIWIPSVDGVSRVHHRNAKVLGAEKFLHGITVNSIVRDRRSNYWFATATGLMRLNSLAVRYVRAQEGLNQPVKLVFRLAGVLYAVAENGRFMKNASGHLQTVRTYDKFIGQKYLVNDLVYLTGYTETYICSGSGIGLLENPVYPALSPTGKLFYHNRMQVEEQNGDSRKIYQLPFFTYTTSFAALGDTDLWLGGPAGLYRFNLKELKQCLAENGFPPDNVSDMKTDPYGNLWVATEGHGIFCIREGKVIRSNEQLNQSVGELYIERISVIGNDIWLCSHSGLMRIRMSSSGDPQEVVRMNKDNAFFSGPVHDVELIGSTLYAATNEGLALVDMNTFDSRKRLPSLSINSIFVNNQQRMISEDVFESDENSVEIVFNALNLGGGELNYMYRLLPVDSTWVSSREGKARFTALAPGMYAFQVKGSLENEALNDMATYTFRILPPFWARPFFYIPLVLGFFGIVIYLFLNRLTRQKKKIEAERNRLDSELKMLHLQMNPHFLFNTLQSIQDFVMQKQGNDAIHYLGRFSRMVRKILSYSKKSSITLEEELTFIDDYVELEQMKNPGDFSYIKDIDPSIDLSGLNIPPMILQPFVENSIKHAVGKGRGDTLKLQISENDNYVIVIIEDNGPGINNTSAEKKHESTGISISTERIRRISGNKPLGDLVNIIDLGSKGGRGTQVILKLNKDLL